MGLVDTALQDQTVQQCFNLVSTSDVAVSNGMMQ